MGMGMGMGVEMEMEMEMEMEIKSRMEMRSLFYVCQLWATIHQSNVSVVNVKLYFS